MLNERREKAPGKATQINPPSEAKGPGVTEHNGRTNDRGGAKYESGGKRDTEERLYVKKS